MALSPAEMLPPESNPERRQVKVNSRHRLHHAAELPALGQAGNMVFCAYISPAGASLPYVHCVSSSDISALQGDGHMQGLPASIAAHPACIGNVTCMVQPIR